MTPFILTIANDLSEYATIRCFAKNPGEAEEIVNALLSHGKLSLPYEAGDDREGPYISDVDQDHETRCVDATIKGGKVLPQQPFKLQCPHCGYHGNEESQHGGTFRYLADQTTYRDVLGFKPKRSGTSKLVIEAQSQTYYEDEEKNERLECRSCLKEFSFPKSVETEFL